MGRIHPRDVTGLRAIVSLARSLGVRPWLALGAVLVYCTCTMGYFRLAGSLKPQIRLACLAHAGSPIKMEVSDAGTALFKAELFDWFRRETPGPGDPSS